MKNLLLSIFACLLLTNTFAQNITENQAIQVAKFFISEQSKAFDKYNHQSFTFSSIEPYKENQSTIFYVINLNPDGYVLLSADKNIWPILGYSFNSNFDIKEMPPSVQSWINNFSAQIRYCYENRTDNKPAQEEWNRLLNNENSNKKSKVVEPMLFSTWNQGKYYNTSCPYDPAGPDSHALTGCVATALGQLCHYFRHPEQGDSSYSYIDENYGLQSVDFSSETYNYEEMPNNPTKYHPEIARLLYHIGVSVDMHYGPNGSGMTNHKAAYSMRTFFGFHDSTQYYFRDSISVDWPGVIIEHLDQRIPMYYAGWGDTNFVSGHAFVCDGYQDSSYFHFNWGWGGSYDGYFYIEDLTPGGSNFTLLHELVVNMVPKSDYPHYISGSREINTYQGTIDDGSGPMYDYLNNLNCSWLITPPDTVSAITLTFNRFDLGNGDYLKIYEGSDNSGNLIGSYTGTTIPDEIETNAQQVFVTFESDASEVGEGFLLGYSSQRASFCGNLTFLTEEAGEISDGSGTFDYRNNTTCTWTLQVSGMNKYNFNFSNFDIEDENDILEIRNSAFELLYIFSGNQIPEPFSVISNNVSIKFITNDTITADGWRLSYTSENIGNLELNDKDDYIKIYPNPANSNLFIELSEKPRNTSKLYIYSTDNKLIYKDLKINSQTISVNMEAFDNGIYLLKLQTENQIKIKKLIIQH